MEPAPRDIVDKVRVIEVATDSCDAKNCPAKAYVYALMPNGHSVSYCSHHGTEYLENLHKVALTVIDLRHTVS